MEENNIQADQNVRNSINLLLFRYLPYWPLFIILLVLFTITALIYINYVPPTYEAVASVAIRDEKKGADNSGILEKLNIYSTKKIVENEIEVIHSRSIVNDVISRLFLYAPVFEESNFIDRSAYSSSPVIIQAKDPDQILKVRKVYFSFNPSSQVITIDGKNYPINEWAQTSYGIFAFHRNTRQIRPSDKKLYFSLMPPKKVADELLKKFDANATSKLSSIITLTVKDEVPQRAQLILNEVLDSYNRASLRAKNTLAANTLEFVEDRMRHVKGELDTIEHHIQQYRSQKGLIDISTQGKLYLENVGDNDRKAADIKMQLAVLDQAERYVIDKDQKAGIVPSTLGINDPTLSQLLQKLSEAEVNYQSLQKTVPDNNSVLLPLRSQIEQLRPLLLENIRNQRTSLQISKTNLASTNSSFSSQLHSLPQKERELIEISRQQATKNNLYSFLLEKREETALSYAAIESDNLVVDKAESSYLPVWPKKIIVLLIAFAVALCLTIFIVSTRELLNNKILFRSEIEQMTRKPITAEVTSIEHRDELVIQQPKKSFVDEQFRQIRASLGLYKNNAEKVNFLITSSISGEGKSFIAANLALSLIQTGKRVVLIDADIRSAKTSRIFGMNTDRGIAEYLEGSCNMKEIIRQYKTGNLYVIPAGRSESNPSELLLNGKLKQFFEELNGRFDYVLVDSAPIEPVTDTYILSEYCDQTLFVIRHDYTPKIMVKRLDENDKVRTLNNLKIIFNCIKKRGFSKEGFGYGYGHGYEYAYKMRN